jgi:hypothetical protein
MMIDMDGIILNTTVALQNPPPGREWICDMNINQAVDVTITLPRATGSTHGE